MSFVYVLRISQSNNSRCIKSPTKLVLTYFLVNLPYIFYRMKFVIEIENTPQPKYMKMINFIWKYRGNSGINCKLNYTIGSDLWWCPDYIALTWIHFAYARAVKSHGLSKYGLWKYGLVLVVCCSQLLSFFMVLLSVSDTHTQC